MSEYENTVAEGEELSGMLADDAQEAEEISVSDIIGTLSEETSETAESEGDGAPETQAEEEEQTDGEKAKFQQRIKSALASQAAKFRPDVTLAANLRSIAGDMTDAEIAEALREHQARRMHESDPEISEKAAKEIIKTREAAKAGGGDDERQTALAQQVKAMQEDGWTTEELAALAKDDLVRRALNEEGKSLRRAAKEYLQRQSAGRQTEKKKGVPTSRTAGAGTVRGDNPIEDMTDEEFARFQKRVEAAAMAGKRVRF